MDDAVEPSGAEVAWIAIEIGIRTCVEICGYDRGSETADWVVADLKRRPLRVQQASIELDEIPPEAQDYVAVAGRRLKETFSNLLGDWLLEVVKLECELWEAKILLLEGAGASAR